MQIQFQTDTVTALRMGENDFSPGVTFGCGQCFRWQRQADGCYRGVAFGRSLALRRQGELLLFEGTTPADFEQVWVPYFDLERDYASINRVLCGDPVLAAAVDYAPGLRILRQEPWEALCSFIISQNNNIPRIAGIIGRLCTAFGDRLADGGYAFPSAGRIAALTLEELAPLRSGFRAKYILDAARKTASGEVSLDLLHGMPLGQAQKALQRISGVGPKVAECALLFGCGRLECFPVDVWIKRVLASFYPQGFPEELRAYGGIAQQYLFHYARCCPTCRLAGG